MKDAILRVVDFCFNFLSFLIYIFIFNIKFQGKNDFAIIYFHPKNFKFDKILL